MVVSDFDLRLCSTLFVDRTYKLYNDEIYSMLKTEYNTQNVDEKLMCSFICDMSPGSEEIDMKNFLETDDVEIEQYDSTIKNELEQINSRRKTCDSVNFDKIFYAVDESKYDEYLEIEDKNSFILKDLANFNKSCQVWIEMKTDQVERLLYQNVVTERDYNTLIEYKEFFDLGQLTETQFDNLATKLHQKNITLFEEKPNKIDKFIGCTLIGYPINRDGNIEPDSDAMTIDECMEDSNYTHIQMPFKEVLSTFSEQIGRSHIGVC